jgi:hypothetical protein
VSRRIEVRVWAGWLYQVDNPSPHVRKNALLVLGCCGRWQALASALKCMDDADENVREESHELLRRWTHLPTDLYTSPNASLRAQIELGCARLTPQFAAIRRNIEFAIRLD